MTGHSRGAAAANLLAAKLIRDGSIAGVRLNESDIYTYTFATPNATKDKEKDGAKFKRIFNIVNPTDFVTKVLPTTWKFGKYGTTYTLPCRTNSFEYRTYKKAMLKEFNKFTNDSSFADYQLGEEAVWRVVTRLSAYVHNTDEFYENKIPTVGLTPNIISADSIIANLLLGVKAYDFFKDVLCPLANSKSSDDEKKHAYEYLATYCILDPYQKLLYSRIIGFFIANQVITSEFEDQHRAETYCAYMMSMSKAEVQKKRAASYNAVNCPVDIEVYEKTTGELVGKITNNVIDEAVAAKENAIVMGVDGDSKSFWLPSDEDYEVKLIGNDEGTMDYTVESIDSDLGETERVNFFDVEITDGLTMTGEMKTDMALEDYSLEYDNGNKLTPTETLSGDEITSYNINVSVEGNGYATESVTASSGDYVTLNATADENSKFVGWYENGEKISDESELSFVAKGNRELTAKFEDEQEEPEPPEQPDDPSATCTHICHKGGISAFFYKIARFFWKLFKTNKYCSCGAAHY